MIPDHLALVPWHPYRQAVWLAIAHVEARRDAGRRLAAYPYAAAFFRQLTGRPTLSAKDLRMIDITYRPGDRRRSTRKEDYIDALDTLIASRVSGVTHRCRATPATHYSLKWIAAAVSALNTG